MLGGLNAVRDRAGPEDDAVGDETFLKIFCSVSAVY